MDKLLDLLNPGTEKPEYYCLASTIYRDNKDFNGAMQLAGRAILIDPENPEGYFLKGVALSCQYYETRENGLAEQSRNEYKLALDKAVRSGNQYFIGAAAGCLAVSYYATTITLNDDMEIVKIHQVFDVAQ